MTSAELRALGMARYGHDWIAPLARAIGINPRHVRRLAAGEAEITEGIEADIRRALGATDITDPDWPRDTWVLGDAIDDIGRRREYIIRLKRPRFTARIVAIDDDGDACPDEEPVDVTTGVVYGQDDYLLAEIVWIDAPPPIAEIHRLLEQACDVVDAESDRASAADAHRL